MDENRFKEIENSLSAGALMKDVCPNKSERRAFYRYRKKAAFQEANEKIVAKMREETVGMSVEARHERLKLVMLDLIEQNFSDKGYQKIIMWYFEHNFPEYKKGTSGDSPMSENEYYALWKKFNGMKDS
jgi:hypothetical protein